MKKIQSKIDKINAFFLELEGEVNKESLVLRKTLKIGEEYGELCDAVLSELGTQRDSKLKKHKREHIENELADILVTALGLARILELDINELIDKKLDYVLKRLDSEYKKWLWKMSNTTKELCI